MLASDLYIISWITLLYASLMEKSTIRLPPRKTYKTHQKFLYKKKNDVTFEKQNYFRGRDLYKLEKYGEMFPIYGRKNIPNPLRLCYCGQNDSDNQYLSVAAES